MCVCARVLFVVLVLFGLGPLSGNAPADGVDVGHHRAGAGDALRARGRKSQKVLSIVISRSKCTRALTFQSLCQAASVPYAPAPLSLRGVSPGTVAAEAVAPRGLRLRGGGLPFRYQDTWNEVVIKMPIDENVKGKDVVYKLTPTSLDLGIKGQALYVSGELWDTVKLDDSIWEIESDNKLGRCVAVHLKKAKGQKWDYLLKSEDVPPDLTVVYPPPRMPYMYPPPHGTIS